MASSKFPLNNLYGERFASNFYKMNDVFFKPKRDRVLPFLMRLGPFLPIDG